MSKKRSINVEVRLSEVKGDQNRLIRKFIKKVKKERVVEEYRERMYYEKPSKKRRRKKALQKQNARKYEEQRNHKLDIK